MTTRRAAARALHTADRPAAARWRRRAQRTRLRALQELQTAITAPMTPRRFVANLLAAPRLTALRIPASMSRARAAFCEERAR